MKRIALVVLLIAGCSDDSGQESTTLEADLDADTQTDAEVGVDGTPDADDGNDAGDADEPDADADADADAEPDLVPAEYIRVFDDASGFPAPGTSVWRRSIIHLHSTHSHDACDGNPRVEGEYNYPCIESLRAALCQVRIDFAYLSDHRDYVHDPPFVDALLHDPETDTLVMNGEVPIANQIGCPDGHVVTTTVGMEVEIMPLRFDGPFGHTPEERLAFLEGEDLEAVHRFKEAGALVWRAHGESR